MPVEHIFSKEEIYEFTSRRLWPPDAPLDWMLRNARRYPDDEAVVDARNRVTWSQVKIASERLALKLCELGIKQEEVVAFQLPPSAEFWHVCYATIWNGTLNLAALMGWRQAEMEHLLNAAEAVAMICRGEFYGFNYLRLILEVKPKVPSLKHIILVEGEAPEGVLLLKDIIEDPIEERYPRDYLDRRMLPLDQVERLVPTSGTTGMPKLTSDIGYSAHAETICLLCTVDGLSWVSISESLFLFRMICILELPCLNTISSSLHH